MLNLPNSLTIARIILIVPFAGLSFVESRPMRWAALAIFILASLTDWLDGYLARKLEQGSALGKMLDPIADKLLAVTALVVLVAAGTIAGWPIVAALLIVLREIAVSGFREHMGQVGVSVPVSVLAKWKTAVQLAALSFLIAPVEIAQQVGVVLLWVAALLTIVTGWSYLKMTLTGLGGSLRG